MFVALDCIVYYSSPLFYEASTDLVCIKYQQIPPKRRVTTTKLYICFLRIFAFRSFSKSNDSINGGSILNFYGVDNFSTWNWMLKSYIHQNMCVYICIYV